MTTSPGWEPRPGPTRGGAARRAPREAAGGWPGDGPAGSRGGPSDGSARGRDGRDPRGRDGRGGPAGGQGQGWDGRDASRRTPRFTENRPPPARGGGQGAPAGEPRGARGGQGGRGQSAGPAGGYPGRPRAGGEPRRDDWARPARTRPPAAAGADPRDGLGALRSSRALRWIGAVSTRNAVLILAAAALTGVAITVLGGSDPGPVLAFFITVGSVVGALCVRRGAVHLFFPLPAIVFFAAAVLTGAVHDTGLEATTAGVGVGFLQWIAAIFIPTCAATALVLLIGGARWLLGRQLVSGDFLVSPGQPGGPRRPGAPGARGPWREPRPQMDRGNPPPGPRPRPGARPAAPNQPRAARPQSRGSWDPGPQRPPRQNRAPRDPWDQR